MILTILLLLLSGDVETNPGPPRGRPEPKPDKNKIMQDKVEAHGTKLEELENLVKSQAELIETLQAKQVEMASELETKQVEAQTKLEDLKTEQSRVNEGLKSDIEKVYGKLTGMDDLGMQSEDTSTKLRELEAELEEVVEKLWELDKSWKNNLVFYGIRSDVGTDENPSITESKIKEVISKKMQISREIPILRAKRSWNGPEVRGSKPITVYFEKWQDKDEILRKSSKLKGSNIYIGEDFSKRVKDQRVELQKFMRTMRKRNPGAKFLLQYDKLFIDKDIYVFNELTGQVEEMHSGTLDTNGDHSHPISPTRSAHSKRSKSSGRKRLQKSYSTESSLNHIVGTTNVHPPDSPQKSPTRPIRNDSEDDTKPGVEITRSESRESDSHDDGPDEDNGHHADENGLSDGGDDIVDYTDSEPYSPSRRLNPQIPETIPE
ncbi:protein unc-13 homolog C-like isoform X2 [Tigriopus californicus]|uniref:protein unc-13 homolog C-like isoform X2 n=1 Tax=Tigriopus californicus TaxID=6832 RepID=UPI0027DA7DC5|nr:protein unc-13 homolog C-like isoform X2 [Tigriopus californicus]